MIGQRRTNRAAFSASMMRCRCRALSLCACRSASLSSISPISISVVRCRGRAFPTIARSARVAKWRAASSAFRSAAFWRELPRRAPPQSAAALRDLLQISSGARHDFVYHKHVSAQLKMPGIYRTAGRFGASGATVRASRSLRSRAPVAPPSVAARPRQSRPHELTFLQTLGKQAQARPVPGQNLHIVAALAPEHEGRARIRSVRAEPARHRGKSNQKPRRISTACTPDRPSRPRELKHQRSPRADRTRRSASVSTSASSDTRAPFGS